MGIDNDNLSGFGSDIDLNDDDNKDNDEEDVWTEHIDKETGNTFWFNEKTEKSQWENPYKINDDDDESEEDEDEDDDLTQNQIKDGDDDLPEPWTRYFNDDNKAYYYNEETKISQWIRPTFDNDDHQKNESESIEQKEEERKKKEKRLNDKMEMDIDEEIENDKKTESKIISTDEYMKVDEKGDFMDLSMLIDVKRQKMNDGKKKKVPQHPVEVAKKLQNDDATRKYKETTKIRETQQQKQQKQETVSVVVSKTVKKKKKKNTII